MLERLGAPARIGVFALLLALVGAAAALTGAATQDGPVSVAKPAMAHMEAGSRGLEASADGYTLVPVRTTVPARGTFRFRVLDARGRAVRDFDLDGGVRLHLIVVRHDFVGYQHLHPTLGGDGSWTVPLELRVPGAYRAFVDFEVGGRKTVLGHDLFVAGSFAPEPLPAETRTASGDGYVVRRSADGLRFRVTRAGKPVEPFATYVGHRGHLVALRDGDLAYTHLHPLEGGAPGEIRFEGDLHGTYRLFLQFKHAGSVHTAAFTLHA